MVTQSTSQPGYSILADLEKPYDFAREFGNSRPVELEVGAGRGDFAVGYCSATPGVNLVCVEKKVNYLKRGVSKARDRGLDNIRFLNVEVQYFLSEYIADSSLQAVHMYFPDPWPKKRHNKRRTFQSGFLNLIFTKLAPGGKLYLRTDHRDYFEQMLEVMSAYDCFLVIPTPEHISVHKTGFENRFVAQGLPIYYSAYELKRD